MEEIRVTKVNGYIQRCHDKKCGRKSNAYETIALLKQNTLDWFTDHYGQAFCPSCHKRQIIFDNMEKSGYCPDPLPDGTWYYIKNEEDRQALSWHYDEEIPETISGWVCIVASWDSDYEKYDTTYYQVSTVRDALKEIEQHFK